MDDEYDFSTSFDPDLVTEYHHEEFETPRSPSGPPSKFVSKDLGSTGVSKTKTFRTRRTLRRQDTSKVHHSYDHDPTGIIS